MVIDFKNTHKGKNFKKCVNSLSLLQTSRAHIRIRNQHQLNFKKYLSHTSETSSSSLSEISAIKWDCRDARLGPLSTLKFPIGGDEDSEWSLESFISLSLRLSHLELWTTFCMFL